MIHLMRDLSISDRLQDMRQSSTSRLEFPSTFPQSLADCLHSGLINPGMQDCPV